MREQENQRPATAGRTIAGQVPSTSACAHPEAVGKRWGDPIDEELQLDLQNYLDQWAEESNHGDRVGPFQKVTLSGADVYWLAERVRNKQGEVPDLHLEGAYLAGAHLEQADLVSVQLAGAELSEAHFEGARLNGAHLEGAHLNWAHMEGTNLSRASLEGTVLAAAHLKGADLTAAHLRVSHLNWAHLEGADLTAAQLEGARFNWARLDGAHLNWARLEGAHLRAAHLEGADLSGASFDKASRLNSAILTGASFDQATFDNANLTVVDWSLVTTIGDERIARERNGANGKPKTRDKRLEEFKAAVRANRVLAVNLQAQGLAEDAFRFAYQAQVLQRQVLRYQRKPGAYLFSLLLAGLAGYGYRLRRILIAYGLMLVLFATAYFAVGQWLGGTHLQWYEAILVSLTAIHGRVFFTQFGLDNLQSWIAALESVVGIVIEGVFLAMLIQRFFGR